MVIFIDDKPIKIISKKDFKNLHGDDFDTLFDARLDKFSEKSFLGHVLILNADKTTIEKFFKGLFEYKYNGFQSISLVVEDKKITENQVKSYYKVIKAAGGVVFNAENKILMMNRLKKWDLPKGKRDDGEKSKETAIREVAEECNIKVELGDKICTTWHTYNHNGKDVLKRTKWYKMKCTDDSKMKPQLEEDITELKWMDEKEIKQALMNSYSSIRFVFECLKDTPTNNLI
jgi:8-oxo-(d)GTP phosphatase